MSSLPKRVSKFVQKYFCRIFYCACTMKPFTGAINVMLCEVIWSSSLQLTSHSMTLISPVKGCMVQVQEKILQRYFRANLLTLFGKLDINMITLVGWLSLQMIGPWRLKRYLFFKLYHFIVTK